jgi:exopolyphosphatase/pppGpp-phosphohydrolase
VAVGQLALVQDQLHPPQPRCPRQHLSREGRHHDIAVDERVGQYARDPLIAHVDPLRRPRQRGGQLHQVGAAHVQHRHHQQRQRLTLGLALPGQSTPQFLADAFRQQFDPAHAGLRPTRNGDMR